MSTRNRVALRLALEAVAYGAMFLFVSYLAGLIRGNRSTAQFAERLAGAWFFYVPLALAFGLLLALSMRWIWRWDRKRALRK